MSLKMEFGAYKGTGPRVRMRRRADLGRRLTRRLSLVAKVPAALLNRASPPEPRSVEITAIAPDKSQLTLAAVSPGLVSSVVGPVLLKYRVCRPRLLLAGSRAEVDPGADVVLLHGEILLIEDSARQYSPIGDTDRRYRATEKLFNAEEEYRECLYSAKELYARPLARNYPDFRDVIFQPLADLAKVSAEFSQRIESTLENWDGEAFKPADVAFSSLLPGDLFPTSFWDAYWLYLVSYAEARRTLEELRANEDPLLHFLRLRQAAARHSPSSLLLLPAESRKRVYAPLLTLTMRCNNYDGDEHKLLSAYVSPPLLVVVMLIVVVVEVVVMVVVGVVALLLLQARLL
ncbi:PREDICTED: uncharacterized protein LOC105359030 [Ceratosolen solmsi marchali]|uniref:Uncharacterized protein LOC105359030 n=1 Tax=Ceratosolen solmsi marchali TaxID=326594 RepID=A0AAJ6VJV5_9HYME|nr:PREDICTED: uncharacterized protein LOC105359030 [Ceratosolen solmsi marchali]